MDTPVQDYLAVRETSLRVILGWDQWAELEGMASNMDQGLDSLALQGLGDHMALAVVRFLQVLTLGQFSQEVRIRLLTENGRET